jgi:hypothetical protein
MGETNKSNNRLIYREDSELSSDTSDISFPTSLRTSSDGLSKRNCCDPSCSLRKQICKKGRKTWDDMVEEALNKTYNTKLENVHKNLDNLLPIDFNGIMIKNKKDLLKNLLKNNLGEKLIIFYNKLQKSWYYEKTKKGCLPVRVTWENTGNIKVIKSCNVTPVTVNNRMFNYGTEYIPSDVAILLQLVNNGSKLRSLIETYVEYKQDVMKYKNNLKRGIFTYCYLNKWLKNPVCTKP